MNPPAIRLGAWQQAYLYTVGVLLVLSGILWLVFHHFVRIDGEFGPTLHPLEPWWLRLHGMAGAAFLIGFGSVLPGHVRRAWGAARNRITDTVFFAVMLTLTLTGLPVLTVWHVWRGRVWRRLKLAEQRAGRVPVAKPADQSVDTEVQRRAGSANG